ncbi:MAG: hypothetical protein ABJF88_17405 [Rhodothermales bacterium]
MNILKLFPLLPALFLGGTLFLAACDASDDADDELALGRFEAEVRGDLEMNLSGIAGFTTETDSIEGIVFSIGLIDPDGEDSVIFVGSGQPAKRTYALSPPDDEEAESGALFFVSTSDDEGAFYASNGGSLTLTAVSSSGLQGRFSFTAVNAFDEDDTLTLRGTFNARAGEVDDATGSQAEVWLTR